MYKSENQIWAVRKLRRCSTFKAGNHIGDDVPEAFREASAWDWRKKKKALREALTLMEIWKVSFFVFVKCARRVAFGLLLRVGVFNLVGLLYRTVWSCQLHYPTSLKR
ncbi:Hypothetical predicted protein, partial [Prunus dulcis]